MLRRSFDLTDGWFIAKDECDLGKSESWEKAVRPEAVPAHVPSIIQEFFPEYHGLAYYWCKFTPDMDAYEDGRILIRFGGVDYKADVWLNGVYLGSEEGGETPFKLDVTDAIRIGEENLLAVRVLNTSGKTIDGLNLMNTPHRNKVVNKSAGSCLNHGGIWYEVSLIAVPSVFVDDVFAIADYRTGELTLKTTFKASKSANAGVCIRIAEKSSVPTTVAESFEEIKLDTGDTVCEFRFKIENFKPWHVDTPNLYSATVTVAAESGEHTYTVRFGFREFCVKDGFFYLNGEKLLLKSSHSGNAFPIGQMLPVDPDHTRRDFIYAKSCGFNMLRAIAGIFRPEQLELADEMGLLIYEECFASWCLGYSMWRPWANDEEYRQLSELYPDILLGDEQAMLQRWIHSTENMILRDRNHPSVVTWGLLNETKDNSVYRTARDFLPRLRELDPTRFVILSSGRWDHHFEVGSAANPYSSEWENTWGIDGHPEVFREHMDAGKRWETITPDNHYYAPFPFKPEDKAIYRSYGKDYLPMFVSEFGHGSVFNVIDEIRCFRQFGSRTDLEDYTWLNTQARAFERDFERLGMNKVFAFPEHALRASQKNSAFARREIFDVLRANPRICGYSLTGLLDHGWCGEGLWSYWRQWKPEMFDTVSEGWAPLRFCLFTSHNVYDDEPITLEAVLANDGVLPDGTYTARFSITENGAPVYTFEEEFYVKGDELASPIMKKALDIKLPAGNYELCAEMDDAAPRANRLSFSIKARGTNRADGVTVTALGLPDSVKKLLSEAGATVKEYTPDEAPEILFVGMGDSEVVANAVNAAERGAKVLFLEWRALEPEPALAHAKRVVPDFSLFTRWDWLYHKELVLNDRTVFDGFGYGLAEGRDFTREWAKICVKTDTTPDYPICPAFETGSHMVPGSYYLVHAISGYNFGKGKVFFNCFELEYNVGSPTADNLIINLAKYLNEVQ